MSSVASRKIYRNSRRKPSRARSLSPIRQSPRSPTWRRYQRQPCSPAYITQVARVIFNYRYVQDAGAYGERRYLCSPLLGDVRAQHLTMPPPNARSNDGYLVWFRQKNPLSDVRQDIQIGRNGNYVSIDPQSYVDLIDPARRPIAAINAETNTILALSPGADGDDMLNAWKLAGRVKSGQWHYAVARSTTRALGVVVKSPRSDLWATGPVCS